MESPLPLPAQSSSVLPTLGLPPSPHPSSFLVLLPTLSKAGDDVCHLTEGLGFFSPGTLLGACERRTDAVVSAGPALTLSNLCAHQDLHLLGPISARYL